MLTQIITNEDGHKINTLTHMASLRDGSIKYINPCVSNMPPHHATRWNLETFRALASKLELVIERVEYESLIARDHYYSTYWVKHCFPAKIFSQRLLLIFQGITARFFDRLFKLLAIFNKKEFVDGLFGGV